MIDPVSGGATTAAPSYLKLVGAAPSTSPTPSASNEPQAPSATDEAAPQARTRVYVDRSDSGVYVYRLVDVATGRVLAELPREASQSLKVLDGYAPGAMASESV